MKKLLELEAKLRKAKEELEKQGRFGNMTASVNTTSEVGLGKADKKHDDEKEDKQLIAEAIDEHNEKKHGESKDEDSAFKAEEIKFQKNGQWSLDKADKFNVYGSQQEAKRDAIIASKPKPAKVTDAKTGEVKMVTPEENQQAKAQAAAQKKAKFEAEAAARRAQYRKEGTLKSE